MCRLKKIEFDLLAIPLTLLLLFFANAIKAVENIPVWTYYASPPFITGDKKGLSYDLIRLLNEYAEGQYQFELIYLPRTRIDRKLDDKMPGMVLFVNWNWMGDKHRSKYLWSLPILNDRNEIISRIGEPSPNRLVFNGKESLKNTVFGGRSGHRYLGLEEAFSDGEIKRLDVREDEQNLELLLRGRIDVTTMSSTVVHYEIKQKNLQDKVFFSPNPLFSYTRHFLLAKKLHYMESFINQFIRSLENSDEWPKIMEQYAIQ